MVVDVCWGASVVDDSGVWAAVVDTEGCGEVETVVVTSSWTRPESSSVTSVSGAVVVTADEGVDAMVTGGSTDVPPQPMRATTTTTAAAYGVRTGAESIGCLDQNGEGPGPKPGAFHY